MHSEIGPVQPAGSVHTDGLITLLAGHSRRMGQPKQHARLGKTTFLERLLQTVASLAFSLSPRLFVGQDSDTLARRLVEDSGGIWLTNPAPENGPLSSIRIALNRLPADHGFLLWPVDHPLVAVSTVEKLLEEAARHPGSIVVPSHGMRRGHPSRFPARARPDLLSGPLDEGARFILQHHPDWVRHLETDDPWTVQNLNTPELLALAEATLQQQET